MSRPVAVTLAVLPLLFAPALAAAGGWDWEENIRLRPSVRPLGQSAAPARGPALPAAPDPWCTPGDDADAGAPAAPCLRSA